MRQNWGKKVSRSKEERNDMEEKQDGSKKGTGNIHSGTEVRDFERIERCKTIKEGLAKHLLVDSVYYH